MDTTANQHNNESSRRAVLYLHTATDTEETDAALDTQRRALYAYAADAGYTVIAEYVDIGKSGKTMSRPQFRACMVALRAHEADILMVRDPSRISRSLADLVACKDELNRLGVSLVTSYGPIDTTFAH